MNFAEYVSDPGMQTFRTLAVQFFDGQLPEFVKRAEIGSYTPPADVSSAVYADPARHLLPCHTKSATFVSGLYFYGGQAAGQAWDGPLSAETVGQRLNKSAELHGIKPYIDKIVDVIRAKSSGVRELTDADFALVEQVDGEKIRRFPVVSSPAIVKSAERLYTDRAHYPYEWRRKASTALLTAAKEHGAKLPDDITAYLTKASAAHPLPPDAAGYEIYRRSINTEDGLRSRMTKLATAMQHIPVTEACAVMDKVASALGTELPEEWLFTVGEQVKRASATVKLITGSEYDLDEIKTAGFDPFGVLDPACIDGIKDGTDMSMSKVAELLPTLPLLDARVFEQALKAAGVHPAGTSKSAGSTLFGGLEGWHRRLFATKMAEETKKTKKGIGAVAENRPDPAPLKPAINPLAVTGSPSTLL